MRRGRAAAARGGDRGDACPVRVRSAPRPCMARGDRGLERIGPESTAELLRSGQCGEAATDMERIPAAAVLIEQEDDLSGRSDSRARPRRLNLHQRDEAVNLGLVWRESGQDSAKTK